MQPLSHVYSDMVVVTDDLVLAMFSQDKRWYRGRVLKVTEALSGLVVEVLYIDYGNVESVPLTKYDRLFAPTFATFYGL